MSLAFQRGQPRLKQPEKPPTKNDWTSWLVLATILVVIVVVFGIIIYIVYKDSQAPDVINRCAPGLCAFNTVTGIKRCPDAGDNVGLRIALGFEACTTENYCQAQGFTCAVQLDQTLNCEGECGPNNDRCRCIANPAP